jgi:hypothetical protein
VAMARASGRGAGRRRLGVMAGVRGQAAGAAAPGLLQIDHGHGPPATRL